MQIAQEKKILQVLPKMKWQYIHKRIRSPLMMYLLFDTASNHYHEKVTFPYEIGEIMYLDGDIAFGKDEWERLRRLTQEKFIKDKGFLVKLLKQSYQENKIIEDYAKKLGKLKKNSDPTLLVRQWERYIYLMNQFGAYLLLPLFVEEYMEKTLQGAIREKFPTGAQDEVFQVLTTPMKDGSILQEETSLLKLAMLKQKKKDIKKPLTKHIEQFSWLKNTSMNGEFYTRKEFEVRINHLLQENPKEKYASYLSKIRRQRERLRTYRNAFRKDAYILTLIDTLQESIYFRSWRTERYYRNAFFLENFFQRTAQILKLKNHKDLFFLTPPEIVDALRGKRQIDEREIARRRISYLTYSDKGKTIIASGNIIKKLKRKIHFFDGERAKELQGRVAFPGKVRGPVRIVLSKLELHKIQGGDILVTTSTTPNFVPVLKKVKAIVTEEGGVLSHASVISRELHIPCIIGAKNATKVLKDGDLVEVDAEQGMVEILNK